MAVFLEVVVIRVINPLDVVGRGSETDDTGWKAEGGDSEASRFQELVEEEIQEVICAELEFCPSAVRRRSGMAMIPVLFTRR